MMSFIDNLLIDGIDLAKREMSNIDIIDKEKSYFHILKEKGSLYSENVKTINRISKKSRQLEEIKDNIDSIVGSKIKKLTIDIIRSSLLKRKSSLLSSIFIAEINSSSDQNSNSPIIKDRSMYGFTKNSKKEILTPKSITAYLSKGEKINEAKISKTRKGYLISSSKIISQQEKTIIEIEREDSDILESIEIETDKSVNIRLFGIIDDITTKIIYEGHTSLLEIEELKKTGIKKIRIEIENYNSSNSLLLRRIDIFGGKVGDECRGIIRVPVNKRSQFIAIDSCHKGNISFFVSINGGRKKAITPISKYKEGIEKISIPCIGPEDSEILEGEIEYYNLKSNIIDFGVTEKTIKNYEISLYSNAFNSRPINKSIPMRESIFLFREQKTINIPNGKFLIVDGILKKETFTIGAGVFRIEFEEDEIIYDRSHYYEVTSYENKIELKRKSDEVIEVIYVAAWNIFAELDSKSSIFFEKEIKDFKIIKNKIIAEKDNNYFLSVYAGELLVSYVDIEVLFNKNNIPSVLDYLEVRC